MPLPIDPEFADQFAAEWIDAWNRRDIEAVLDHYADDFEFTSPFIAKIAQEPSGTLRGKAPLRSYFERALGAVPNLRFELLVVFRGINSLVLHYRSHRAEGSVLAAEVLIFGGDGKVVRGFANYENS